MQVLTSIESASTTDSDIVVFHATLISVNCFFLSVMLHALTSSKEGLFYSLLGELLIDKAYVLLQVLGRQQESLIDHIALLFPLLLTIFSAQSLESARRNRSKISIRSLRVVNYIAGGLGLSILGMTIIPYTVQMNACFRILGQQHFVFGQGCIGRMGYFLPRRTVTMKSRRFIAKD